MRRWAGEPGVFCCEGNRQQQGREQRVAGSGQQATGNGRTDSRQRLREMQIVVVAQ